MTLRLKYRTRYERAAMMRAAAVYVQAGMPKLLFTR